MAYVEVEPEAKIPYSYANSHQQVRKVPHNMNSSLPISSQMHHILCTCRGLDGKKIHGVQRKERYGLLPFNPYGKKLITLPVSNNALRVINRMILICSHLLLLEKGRIPLYPIVSSFYVEGIKAY